MTEQELRKIIRERIANLSNTQDDKVEEYYSAPSSLEKRNDLLYDELVPGSGSAGTIEGEMLRAINRIIYRHNNDGDYFHQGYGTETAGPAAAFLYDCRGIDRKLQGKIRKLIDSMDGDSGDTSYGKKAYSILELILDDIEAQNGDYHKSREDMYDYESKWEEEEYGDEWDDEYYESTINEAKGELKDLAKDLAKLDKDGKFTWIYRIRVEQEWDNKERGNIVVVKVTGRAGDSTPKSYINKLLKKLGFKVKFWKKDNLGDFHEYMYHLPEFETQDQYAIYSTSNDLYWERGKEKDWYNTFYGHGSHRAGDGA